MPTCNNYLYYWVIFANLSLNLKQLFCGSSGIQHQQVLFFFFKLVSYKILFTKKWMGLGRTYVRIAYVPCLYQRVMVNEVRMLTKENPQKILPCFFGTRRREGNWAVSPPHKRRFLWQHCSRIGPVNQTPHDTETCNNSNSIGTLRSCNISIDQKNTVLVKFSVLS